MVLDHLIVQVNDAEESARFYADVLGFENEGSDGPFTRVRVSPDLTLELGPFGTEGGAHLAFAVDRNEFDEVFDRLRKQEIPYGDAFDTVGNMAGPGEAAGARGLGTALYFFDPNQHLIEIRHYESR